MISLLARNPIEFFIIAILLIVAIAIHEFAHAFAADTLGDPTARLAGRLTLNPMAHLDPWGTLLLLFAGFGWGKPVPFDPFNLREPKKDAAIISFAGPFSNILMAVFASLILRLFISNPFSGFNSFISDILILFMQFNLILAVFNLIPIHPLDGFKVVGGLIPHKYYDDWAQLEPYGMIFLIFLIFPFFGTSPISSILGPLVNFAMSILLPGSMGGTI